MFGVPIEDLLTLLVLLINTYLTWRAKRNTDAKGSS